jgi:hypothetical protein
VLVEAYASISDLYSPFSAHPLLVSTPTSLSAPSVSFFSLKFVRRLSTLAGLGLHLLALLTSAAFSILDRASDILLSFKYVVARISQVFGLGFPNRFKVCSALEAKPSLAYHANKMFIVSGSKLALLDAHSSYRSLAPSISHILTRTDSTS